MVLAFWESGSIGEAGEAGEAPVDRFRVAPDR